MEGETPVEKDATVNRYVSCVASAITALPRVQARNRDWEVVVFDQKQTVDAFALPGGKIGVYSGTLTAARMPRHLAAVLGHEVGHVVARHGNERMSQQFAVGRP